MPHTALEVFRRILVHIVATQLRVAVAVVAIHKKTVAITTQVEQEAVGVLEVMLVQQVVTEWGIPQQEQTLWELEHAENPE